MKPIEGKAAVYVCRDFTCRAPVTAAHSLCARCWGRIAFLSDPLCAVCGFPFEFDPGPDTMLEGDVIGAVTIPVIAAGGDNIFEFPWNPPDPAPYAGSR